jgi:drug/metabolite transporter (DMT)-like permease
MSRRGGPIAGLVLASALWGGAVAGTKYALEAFDPYVLLAVALVSATAALWAVALSRGMRPPRSWRLAVLLGLLEPGGAYLAETVGLSKTSAAAGAIACGLESAFVVVLAALVLKERITRTTAVAVLLAFAGLVVLQGANPLGGSGLGDLYVAAGVLSASAYTVVVKKYSAETDPLALTVYQFSAATVLALVVASGRLLSGASHLPAAVPPRFWVAGALIGILGYALPFVVFNSVIGRIGAGAASVVLNLIPAFGVLFALVLLGETLNLATALGALLVAGSVVTFIVVELAGTIVISEPVSLRLPEPRRQDYEAGKVDVS